MNYPNGMTAGFLKSLKIPYIRVYNPEYGFYYFNVKANVLRFKNIPDDQKTMWVSYRPCTLNEVITFRYEGFK